VGLQEGRNAINLLQSDILQSLHPAILQFERQGCYCYSVPVRSARYLTATILVTLAAAAACRTASPTASPTAVPAPFSGAVPIVQPGAPGQPSQIVTSAQASDLSRVSFTPADVSFMQGMIGHHSQAVEMTALIPTHTTSQDLQKLGQRIALSQADEISMMQRWLETRGQDVPGPHAMHMHGAMLMPGMLSAEEMDRLSAAQGATFDRLFLEGMIKHHQGALTMVGELFSQPGAAQDSEIFAFASDVDGDQRMEIARMGAMLREVL
jgi:uncharacterized protein (DUF305 family)